MQKDYASIATKYAQDVVSGNIPACKWVRLACQRHLNDLEQSENGDYPYRFDTAKAARACGFIEKLPHVKGRWAAKHQKLLLQPWQVFIVASLFGWVNKETNLRRYRQAYVNVPRKNGKSPLAAGIGLYMLCADNEAGAEVYCGATTESQAHEVFRPAKMMADKLPEMCAKLGISVNAKSLVVEATGSRFIPVIGKPGDGASPSCGICDEFHEADHSELIDTFITGMVGREQPILLIITTAGTNIGSPCYAFQEQAQKVLEGTFDDDQLFVVIHTIDASDDWTTEAALRKANPNWNISVDPEALLRDQKIAVNNSGKRNIFKTKHCNVWCTVQAGWMSMEKWHECADPSLSEAAFAGKECYVGVDLANKIDIAATVRVFRAPVDGKDHYYVFGNYYLPQAKVDEVTNQHYQKWANDGYLDVTPGIETDYSAILNDLMADCKQFRVREVAYDPWSAAYFCQELRAKTGVTTVEVPQLPRHLSEPMKRLEALVMDGRIHHDGNPLMTWCMSNVVAKEDRQGNIAPSKGADRDAKIDSAAALITALSRATTTTTVRTYSGMQFI